MNLGFAPFNINIPLESNPPQSRFLIRELAVLGNVFKTTVNNYYSNCT